MEDDISFFSSIENDIYQRVIKNDIFRGNGEQHYPFSSIEITYNDIFLV